MRRAAESGSVRRRVSVRPLGARRDVRTEWMFEMAVNIPGRLEMRDPRHGGKGAGTAEVAAFAVRMVAEYTIRLVGLVRGTAIGGVLVLVVTEVLTTGRCVALMPAIRRDRAPRQLELDEGQQKDDEPAVHEGEF